LNGTRKILNSRLFWAICIIPEKTGSAPDWPIIKPLKSIPDNHTALNNLAWLLSTCEDHRFRDVTTAIQLAEKAVSLNDSAQLLDTLAESYAAAGRWEEALAAAKRALQMATQDLPYFEKQVERFLKRLKTEG